MGQDPAVIRQEIEHTRERMGETVDALGYRLDVPARAKESVSGKVEQAKEKLSGATAQLTGAVSGAMTQVSDAAPTADDVTRVGRQSVGVAQENPLGLAVGAVAVGFLAGMLIPSTTVEDRQLGP